VLSPAIVSSISLSRLSSTTPTDLSSSEQSQEPHTLKAGWPDELVEKIAQIVCSPNNFCQNWCIILITKTTYGLLL
jgi:hypothetical protein